MNVIASYETLREQNAKEGQCEAETTVKLIRV